MPKSYESNQMNNLEEASTSLLVITQSHNGARSVPSNVLLFMVTQTHIDAQICPPQNVVYWYPFI